MLIIITIDEIKNLIKSPQYDFLRTNEHLKDNIILLTLGGSIAYGTNIDTSDIDIRGCTLNRAEELLGFSTFEQFNNKETDTVVYSFNKLVNLLLNCNPNVIEMLGCKPEHYLYLSKEGQEMLDNKHLFLSQRAANSFGGYAIAQLRRLQNAVARDRVEQAVKEQHILQSLQSSLKGFDAKYSSFDESQIKLYTAPSKKEEFEEEVFADINLKHYPARQFNSILNDLKSVVSTYDKLNHRNNKKDDAHLNKHAMHLVRLYLMGIDILEKEEINTYRGKEREMLLEIRNGKYQDKNGTYVPEFFEFIDELQKRFDYAVKNTNLPKKPDYKKIEEFVMEVNRRNI